MPQVDQSRIQGFGSDGTTTVTWRCPKDHLLQPWKANAGRCDGCNAQVQQGDMVMDCRQCNWYLCQSCHPQQNKDEDWFWGSVNYFVEQASQEFNEISAEFHEMAGELETFVNDMALQSSCGVVDTAKITNEEINFDSKGEKKVKKSKKQDEGKRAREERRRADSTASAASASGAEADEEGEARGEAPLATSKGSSSSKRGSGSEDTGSTTSSQAAAKEEVATAPPPRPMEDLLDLGQEDLLDLDLDIDGAASADPSADARPPAAAGPMLDLEATLPGEIAAPAPVAAPVPAIPALAAPPAAAARTALGSAGAVHEDLLDLDLDAGKPPASMSSAPAPAAAPNHDLLPDLLP